MKTSVEIDEKLLTRVKRILKTHTIKDSIEKSFKEVIRYQALAVSADALGTIDLDLTPEALVKQRKARAHVLG